MLTRPPPLALTLVALLVSVSGCSSTPYLDLLHTLDVADLTIEEAERTAVDVVAGRAGSPAEKPRAAEVRQRYQPIPGVTASEAFDALASAVAAHGWELVEGSGPEFVSGQRDVEGLQVELSLYVPTYADDTVLLRLQAR